MPNMVAMMNDGMNQQTLRIDENAPLLALEPKPPFFSAFNALAIDDGGGGTGFPANRFAVRIKWWTNGG